MRRAGLALATVLVAVAGVIGVIAFFNARDDAGVQSAETSGPGERAPDATGAELKKGNVVLLYGTAKDRAALRKLADDVAGPPDPGLVDAGQAIIVRKREGTGGVVAEAYKRRLKVADASDPQLRAFAERWLGASQ